MRVRSIDIEAEINKITEENKEKEFLRVEHFIVKMVNVYERQVIKSKE